MDLRWRKIQTNKQTNSNSNADCDGVRSFARREDIIIATEKIIKSLRTLQNMRDQKFKRSVAVERVRFVQLRGMSVI